MSAPLAAAIRRLNARISTLPSEEVAVLQEDWNRDWVELEQQLHAATSDQQAAEDVARWQAQWLARLDKPTTREE